MGFAATPEPAVVAEGDIWQLGRHRLMCGDATDKEAVARLFDGRQPTLVVTSPPYAKQRDYDRPINCWDSVMMGALNNHNFAADAQLLVNLGVIHSKNEWQPYWWQWLQKMRAEGWRHVAQYVWSKSVPSPGAFGSRLVPSHEFVFHFNKKTVPANKWQPTNCVGHTGRTRTDVRDRDGFIRRASRRPVASQKVPESVIIIKPVTRWQSTGHPAQMPVGLASFILRTWAKTAGLSYDPFAGSGTSILACESEEIDGLGMEISPAYCQIAIDRWNRANPGQAAKRLVAG